MIEKVKRWAGTGIYLSAVLLLSAVVLGSFFRVGMNGYTPAMFRDMVDGTAHRPFACRAFAPLLIRTVENALPDSVKHLMMEKTQNPVVQDVFRRYNWNLADAVTCLSAAVVLYIALLLFVHAFTVFAKTQYEMNRTFLRILSLAALAMLPCCFRYYSYIYDFPNLAVFTYSLTLLASCNWALYLLLFPVAVFSKETAVLLILIYILRYWKDRKTIRYWMLLAGQGLLYVSVKLYVNHLFQNNPGEQLELHLGHNLTLNPYNFGQFGALLAFTVLCARHWKAKPVFLRSAVWMLGPMLLPAVLFGMFDEYRAFYEAWPVLLLLATPPIAEYLEIKPFKSKNENQLYRISQI